jgi:predicted metalloenzyme YecM
VVSSRKLDRKLRLANATKSTQDVSRLSTILSMPMQQYTFDLLHLRWPIDETASLWNALKAKGGLIFSKV